MTAKNADPEDTPLVRHVLYTNECIAVLSSVVGALLWRARPERVRAALEFILQTWDERVLASRLMADQASGAERSGWEDPPRGSN